MKFVFKAVNGAHITDCTEHFALGLLKDYAQDHDLDLHLHPGGWAGNAISTAYMKGGDELLDAQAVVRPQR